MKNHYPYHQRLTTNGMLFFQNVLHWAQAFQYVCALDHNEIAYPMQPFQRIIGVSNGKPLDFLTDRPYLPQLQACLLEQKWLLGFLSYDLKNEIEDLSTQKAIHQALPPIFFFEPEFLFLIYEGVVEIHGKAPIPPIPSYLLSPAMLLPYKKSIKALTDKPTYLADVARIRQHIEEGDVYEMNYCMAYEGEGQPIDPFRTFLRLNSYSPMPFASYLKIKQQYVLCASPERFLKKEGNRLLSQPIKGTVKRGETEEGDLILRAQLQADEKERAENMMIVDLVRNDLAKIAEYGSVKVEEMFGIYTFKQLHQMISSVSANLREGSTLKDILRATFPMGSMTGAPKVMAMELIDHYEKAGRGLFSGAIGYITPRQDFDFNVVIRTLFYDELRERISFQVGSAITYDSVPMREYEECLLKAAGILKALGIQ